MPYRETGTECFDALAGEDRRTICVGWLSEEHAFPQALPDPVLVAKLFPLIWRCSARQMRGFHDCPLCHDTTSDEAEFRVTFASPKRGRTRLGSAEIWIPDRDQAGLIWVAPNLIVHYITFHNYNPPAGFWRAVAGFIGGETWDADGVASRFSERHRDDIGASGRLTR